MYTPDRRDCPTCGPVLALLWRGDKHLRLEVTPLQVEVGDLDLPRNTYPITATQNVRYVYCHAAQKGPE